MWGTRGSLASPGPETSRYGGNTSCVEIAAGDGTRLVLDAGTGMRRAGASMMGQVQRIDILLTHLHLDHLQGLGFFDPLYDRGVEVHVYGPASFNLDLRARLNRYLSPPLFPVHLRDLPSYLTLHEVPCGDFQVGELRVSSAFVCHPGPTVGYRIEGPDGVVAYLPDHEPALGVRSFPDGAEWTSGYELAAGSDLLIHDAQYSDAEYESHVGWGHSSISHALAFGRLAGVGRLVLFHHDPTHGDTEMDRLIGEALARVNPGFPVSGGVEESTFEIGGSP